MKTRIKYATASALLLLASFGMALLCASTFSGPLSGAWWSGVTGFFASLLSLFSGMGFAGTAFCAATGFTPNGDPLDAAAPSQADRGE